MCGASKTRADPSGTEAVWTGVYRRIRRGLPAESYCCPPTSAAGHYPENRVKLARNLTEIA